MALRQGRQRKNLLDGDEPGIYAVFRVPPPVHWDSRAESVNATAETGDTHHLPAEHSAGSVQQAPWLFISSRRGA